MSKKPTDISIIYGNIRARSGAPGGRQVYKIKAHDDVFVDNIGDCKVVSIALSEDGTRLPVIDEAGNQMMVETNKIRPLNSINEYDLKVLRNKIENAKKMKELNLQPLNPTESPVKQTRKPSARGAVPGAPNPDRYTRSEAASAARKRQASEEAAVDDKEEEPAEGLAGEQYDDAASPENTAKDKAEDMSEDKRLEAMLEKVTAKQMRRMEIVIEKRFAQVRRELSYGGTAKGIHKKKSGKKGKKQPTKEALRAQGSQALWDLFEIDDTLDPDDIDMTNVVPDQALVDKMLQPFIKPISAVAFEFFGHGFAPKKLLIQPTDTMRLMYLGVEGRPPTAEFLSELVKGGVYATLRISANRIIRDLKNRFFTKTLLDFKQVVTDDAIANGKVHDTKTLFSSPWAPTLSAEYGEFNRGDKVNDPIVLPAFAQHLPMWSEKILSQDLTTGHKSMKVYVGGAILTKFIQALTIKSPTDEDEDALPKLDSLSVFVAYVTAKEHGLSINHGIRLGLAAAEWKSW